MVEPNNEPPLTLARLLASLSFALDLTEGQPMGHAMRTCVIGLRIASVLGLSESDHDHLHLTLLLKDAGCSSNAARMFSLFGGNEILAKRDAKIRDWCRVSEAIKFALRHAAPQENLLRRVDQLRVLAQQPVRIMDVLTEARCSRGAEIAHLLGLPQAVADAIYGLDEHWDGSGAPYHRKGLEIPLLARIACLAQTLEVFLTTFGPERASQVLRERSATWFDPEIVTAAQTFLPETAFLATLQESPDQLLAERTSARLGERVTDVGIDRVCAAFARIVDAKSSFTGEHSVRVATYADQLAQTLGLSHNQRTTLYRSALLHDLGKLAIPNFILDKPGRLTAEEFAIVQKHPYYTMIVLRPIPGFERIADIAAAHHEKLDGTGYFRGLTASSLDREMRILTVADIFDAMTAHRPYRPSLSFDSAIAILRSEAGITLDRDVVDAVNNLTVLTESQPVLQKAA